MGERELTIEECELLRDAIGAYLARPMPSDWNEKPSERRRRKILRDLSDDLRVSHVRIAA